MEFSDYTGTGSPGDGITEPGLSAEPLATEGEATPGPNDYNPFEEERMQREMNGEKRASLPDFGGPRPGNVDVDGPGGLPPLFPME
jgi:hypothetical protein